MLWLHSMGGVSQRTGIKADHSKRVVMLSYCGPPKVAWRSPILSWPRIMFFMFSHLGWQDGTFGALSYCVHRMTFMSKNVMFSKNRHWNGKVSLPGHTLQILQRCLCTKYYLSKNSRWYFFLHKKEKSSCFTETIARLVWYLHDKNVQWYMPRGRIEWEAPINFGSDPAQLCHAGATQWHSSAAYSCISEGFAGIFYTFTWSAVFLNQSNYI